MSIELDLDNDVVSLSSWNSPPAKEAVWNNHEVTLVQAPSEPIVKAIPDNNYNFQNRQVVELCYKGDEVREKRELHKEDGWLKTFWKKHKKAIIITTVVVVAVTIIVVVTVATCGTATTAGSVVAGGAGIGKAATSKDDDDKKDTSPAKSPQDNRPNTSIVGPLPGAPEVDPHKSPVTRSPTDGVDGSVPHTNPVDTTPIQHNPNIDINFTNPPDRSRPASDAPDSRPAHPGTETLWPNTDPARPSTTVTVPQGDRDRYQPFLPTGGTVLSDDYYRQAIRDIDRAIASDPSNPNLFLDRGMANFHLGNYDDAIADYYRFEEKTERNKLQKAGDFALGYLEGIHKGYIESGKLLALGIVDFVKNPGLACIKVAEAISDLAKLTSRGDWKTISQALAPEIVQLVTEWNNSTDLQRGKLTGNALGKFLGDCVLPGASGKLATQFPKVFQKITTFSEELTLATKLQLLEAAANAGSPAKIAQAIQRGEQIAFYVEEMGISTQELSHLKSVEQVEAAIAKKYKHLTISKQESIDLHKRARDNLGKKYAKIPMLEERARQLIKEQGFPTFPRPKGIPENYLVMVTDSGTGMEYVHPTNTHTRIRVMPGQLHSDYPHQQRPYVIQKKDGRFLDNFGNVVEQKKPAAHISLEEYVYRGE